MAHSNSFDAIRYYLAFIVVFAHFSILTGADNFRWFNTSGEAVSGFFILSGFVVYQSYMRNADTLLFCRKRLARILPPYVFIVMLCAVLGCVISNLPVSEYFSSSKLYRYLAANLCFLNFLGPELPGVFVDQPIHSVNGSLWTLKVELLLYATVPLVYHLSQKFGKKKTLIAVFIFSIMYKEGFLWLYENSGKEIYRIISYQFGGQLIYFYSGTALLLYFDWFERHIKPIFVSALLLYAMRSWIDVLNHISPFCFAVILVGIAFHTPKLNFIGRIPNVSYGIYLFHFPVIQCIVYSGMYDRMPNISLVLSVLITVALSFFSWYFIEKRFIVKKRT